MSYTRVPTEVMKAALFDKPGGPEVLKVKDVPMPHLGTTRDVLVEVFASSLNKVDIRARAGDLSLLIGVSPHGCGADFAGRIVIAGSQVTRFVVGDEVFGFLPSVVGLGAYAQYVVVDQDWIVPKPTNLSFLEAASVPLVALTAWQALIDICKLQSGQSVLVHGGAGGVGMWAIQLAKYLKAWVVTTCSTEHIARCKELGADLVIDHTSENFAEIIAKGRLDVVIDTVGGDIRDKSATLLKRDGWLVELNPVGDEYQKAYGKAMGLLMEAGKAATEKMIGSTLGPHRSYMIATPNGTQLTLVTRLLESGVVKTYIDSEFPFARVSEAHAYFEQGHTQGKVVLNMKERQVS